MKLGRKGLSSLHCVVQPPSGLHTARAHSHAPPVFNPLHSTNRERNNNTNTVSQTLLTMHYTTNYTRNQHKLRHLQPPSFTKLQGLAAVLNWILYYTWIKAAIPTHDNAAFYLLHLAHDPNPRDMSIICPNRAEVMTETHSQLIVNLISI